MYFNPVIGALGLLAAPLAVAAADCGKFDSLNNPKCFRGEFNLETNYYEKVPDKGQVREYNFTLTSSNMAPDGVNRTVLSINGQVPGPTIFAEWGDTIIVHLTNSLPVEGTSLHFHGIRQLGTNEDDGVASITQCPTRPGETITYKWTATQYGTSWYHSHYSVQAWDGVFGAIHINGPASQKYDIDLGPVTLSDWTHEMSETLLPTASKPENDGVVLNNGLINGTNIYKEQGKHFEMTLTPGLDHRLRLINTAIDTFYAVTIDNHNMTVISADFVAVDPFTTSVLKIGHGQRYDVIIHAKNDSDIKDFWFRAQAQGCTSSSQELDNGKNITAIIRYGKGSGGLPNTTIDNVDGACDDMPIESLVPSLKLKAPEKNIDNPVEFQQATGSDGLIHWEINNTPYLTQWGKPILQQVVKNDTNFDPLQHVVQLPQVNQTVYLLITNNASTFHPIHLHGHDFWVLSQGSSPFDPSKPLNLTNPPRRDVAVMPFGHLLIAFVTDNPGAWLMHCHIGWHTSQGFAMTFLERSNEIPLRNNPQGIDTLNKQCEKWNDWAKQNNITQPDSGV